MLLLFILSSHICSSREVKYSTEYSWWKMEKFMWKCGEIIFNQFLQILTTFTVSNKRNIYPSQDGWKPAAAPVKDWFCGVDKPVWDQNIHPNQQGQHFIYFGIKNVFRDVSPSQTRVRIFVHSCRWSSDTSTTNRSIYRRPSRISHCSHLVWWSEFGHINFQIKMKSAENGFHFYFWILTRLRTPHTRPGPAQELFLLKEGFMCEGHREEPTDEDLVWKSRIAWG